ncbi:hypothetical protein QJS10_CPB19g01316 [Acorus calamus]|uniref:G domain-containing protein n=1 Tax=Acorus calamus TaxID=4465 RepID=A0AAV9CD20_ACOCL|nr:hypothetical protein QJS10_CPB19g01316 [Acorus calamus]
MQTTMCFKDHGGIVLNSIAEATSGPLAPHWGVFGSQTIYDCALGQYKSSSLDKSVGKSTLQDVPMQMHHDTEQGPVSTILEKDGQVTTKFSPFSVNNKMGKKEKSSSTLGRALVRQHNQMVQQSKEKGRFTRPPLVSVTDVSDIDAVIERTEEADRLFSLLNSPSPDLPIQLPPWNSSMTVEQLDVNEKQAFLVWRRSLARLEENEKLILTPFEKNLDIWRQLWRVLERSDLLVMVVDARDPLFYRCPDLEAYARENDEHKKTLLLVNKADLLPFNVRQRWAEYFHLHGILYLFWSAKAATAALEGKQLNVAWEDQNSRHKPAPPEIDTKIYGREELLARLQSEAEAIVISSRSSTINALVGEKRTGVTSTPGKTKHFQTLIISEELTLCDCPGLVFPSFSSSRYEMIASGVLPIDRMTEHREAVQIVCNRVPRHALEGIYKISLPKPKPYEPQSRPPLAVELLRTYCASRGYVGSSGLPDETKAARQILKDYIEGKLPHFEMPPGVPEEGKEEAEVTSADYDSDDCASDDQAKPPELEHILDDLASFEISISSPPAGAKKKKAVVAASTHKHHHKKPQRKKDRSWRVGNDGGDGMPVVRVFQKPAVDLGAIKAG